MGLKTFVCARTSFMRLLFIINTQGKNKNSRLIIILQAFPLFYFLFFCYKLPKKWVYIIPHEAIQQYEIKNTALNWKPTLIST